MNRTTGTTERIATKWDKIFSTYYWIIYLDPAHPQNNPRIQYMRGYSKAEKQSEARDKDYLLKSKVINLAKHGYLDKCTHIEMKRRTGNTINESIDKVIFTLYKKDFKIPPEHLDKSSFIRWLEDLYQAHRKDKNFDGLLSKPKTDFSQDDLFKIEKYKFATLRQLIAQCDRFINFGHPKGMVEGFYTKYLDFHPELKEKLY